MRYADALAVISSFAGRGWRLGLDRMQKFSEMADLALGPTDPAFIHVAGTNGKGSVTALIQSLLVEQGYRTGGFFSPYVVDPRERIQLGREWVGKRALASAVQTLLPYCDEIERTSFGPLTEFEFKMAIGLLTWKRHSCDWVALEVGLGGELDATNIVFPRSCVIVSIGYDHQKILGQSLAEIAGAKAGIIKPGVPVIVGSLPKEAMQVIELRAKSNGSPLVRMGHEIHCVQTGKGLSISWPGGSVEGINPPLVGAKQPENTALAIAAIAAARALIDPSKIREGLAKTRIPARMQKLQARGCEWLIDGAHNLDSARHLVESTQGQKFILVAGMLLGHEPGLFFDELQSIVTSAHFTPIQDARTMMPAQLKRWMPGSTAHENLREALLAATRQARKLKLPILVTGSFYLAGEVLRYLGPVAAIQNNVSNLRLGS